MICPTIHMNGSSADTLRHDWAEAYSAIGEAIEKLCQCAPHGRDFYVQTPNGFEQARLEHEDRLRRLQSVRKELEGLVRAVDQQVIDRRPKAEPPAPYDKAYMG